MLGRSSIVMIAAALASASTMPTGGARAEDAKYPNWKGEWDYINPRFGGQGVKYDPTKAFGPAQQAPLTPEYQKVHQDSMADQGRAGQLHRPCPLRPGRMPAMMSATRMEYVLTAETTYISTGTDLRRIFTDGRPWPTDLEATYQGYAIGHWIDTTGGGIFDTLEAETRGPFKGPRAYDATGLPLHFDNESVFKERFHLDRNDSNLLHDEITTFDHALTRPWSVDKTFKRNPNPYPNWSRVACTETTQQMVIGKESYMMSADGFLMPAKKDQAPPDLRYFKQTQK